MLVFYLCFLAAVWEARGASAPFIKPCALTDTSCVVASAQAAIPSIAPGIPSLGMKSLDPMYIAEVKSNEGGLNLLFKDSTLTGMKDCKVEGFRVKFDGQDQSKGKQQITLRCTVDLKGTYSLSGHLLVLPVQGDGTYNIQIQDIIIKSTTELETVVANGKKHWHITSWKHSYTTQTGARFQFDNLFNGNKILAAPVDEFLNKNWSDMMSEVAPPIVRTIVSNVIDAVQALYKSVPVDQLSL